MMLATREAGTYKGNIEARWRNHCRHGKAIRLHDFSTLSNKRYDFREKSY